VRTKTHDVQRLFSLDVIAGQQQSKPRVPCDAVSALRRADIAAAVIRLGRSFVAVALCAQLAHGVLYQSVLPRTGAHAYFSWYLPVLAAAVVAALAALPASVAADGTRGSRSLAALLPERRPGRAARDVLRLAIASAVYFVVQESLEHSAELGSFQVARVGALAWLVLVLALLVAAASVVALERTLSELVVQRVPPRTPRSSGTSWPSGREIGARPRPLAVHGGLRAPPLTV
jgi:hypothetical protein